MNQEGPEDLEEEGVGGEGVWAADVGEESAGAGGCGGGERD